MQLTNLDPSFRENPYPILAALRDRAPVFRDDDLGRFVLTRHDDVYAVLRDLEMWSDPRKANENTFSANFLRGSQGEEPSMLLMDDPGHRRLRDLVRRSFTPRSIRAFRDRIRSVAERLAEAIAPGQFDAIAAFADPLPAVVIAEMLGLDASSFAQFKEWSDLMAVVGFNPAPTPEESIAGEKARVALETFFLLEIEKRRKERGDDLVSDMVYSELEGDQLTDAEITRQCTLLLLAGNITTTDLIGNGIKALLDHPDQLAKLRLNEDLLPNAVEEILRFESPVTTSGRIPNRDVEIGGVLIPKGATVSVMLAAANRDPEVYSDPDVFEIEREDTHHQAFGGGRHFCLGAHLARLEAQESLRAFLNRFDSLRAVDGGHTYATTPTFRGLTRLEVVGTVA